MVNHNVKLDPGGPCEVWLPAMVVVCFCIGVPCSLIVTMQSWHVNDSALWWTGLGVFLEEKEECL